MNRGRADELAAEAVGSNREAHEQSRKYFRNRAKLGSLPPHEQWCKDLHNRGPKSPFSKYLLNGGRHSTSPPTCPARSPLREWP